MCYHKQIVAVMEELTTRYQASFHDNFVSYYYENGFDHLPAAVIANRNPRVFETMSWGLIPSWTKTRQDAEQMRVRTLNCISEEAFEKPAFRDAIRANRCLVPCTGFFEWRWFQNGKVKYPYFIRVPNEKIFSLAGIWSEWTDRATGEVLTTYSVLTSKANPLMEKIHNSKKRMPVILPRQYEMDWLNPNLTKEDVLALCAPYTGQPLEAHTISKMITDRKVDNKNVPAITQAYEYPELALLDS
jgi:putative SOS response-associated peptidase YedK